MAIWHSRSRRKPTGGRLRPHRKHKKYELGRLPARTTIGERKLEIIRVRGGNYKFRLKKVDYANVVYEGGKVEKKKVVDVVENKANPHFVREKIITKGAIIKLEDGTLARVTSRPGQDGVINVDVIKTSAKA